MSQPLLNIWFKEQDWPLESSQIWHSFWSHANPQWEYLFSQNLCIIWHSPRFLLEVTHCMHNSCIACLHLSECLRQSVRACFCSDSPAQVPQSCHLQGTWSSVGAALWGFAASCQPCHPLEIHPLSVTGLKPGRLKAFSLDCCYWVLISICWMKQIHWSGKHNCRLKGVKVWRNVCSLFICASTSFVVIASVVVLRYSI